MTEGDSETMGYQWALSEARVCSDISAYQNLYSFDMHKSQHIS